jgi:hypothetical protein
MTTTETTSPEAEAVQPARPWWDTNPQPEPEAQPEPEPYPSAGPMTEAEADEIRSRMTGLAARAADLDDKVRNLRDAVDREHREHIADVHHIAARLDQEAEDRDWCGEFDQIKAEVNGGLYVTMPARSRTYTVTITCTYEIEATNSAEAAEAATDEARSQDSIIDWNVDECEPN